MEEHKYKLGYYSIFIDAFDPKLFVHLKECSSMCEYFVMGIPDNYVMAQILGKNSAYSCKMIKEFLMDFSWINDVIILNWKKLSRQKVYKQVPYDVCFYGSEYGKQFEKDKVFWESKGITYLSKIPERIDSVSQLDALHIALQNVSKEKKIVLYGTGEYFDYYMAHYGLYHVPEYAVDDDKEKWNSHKNNILIQSPEALKKENAEKLLVIICSNSSQEICQKLKETGSFDYRTLFINNQIAILDEFYVSRLDEEHYIKRAHEILYHLMKEFDRVCTKHGLRYYVLYGSLIGVVRHQGMIPWDDDIDVGMPRADFDKLCQIAHEEWNTDEFTFLRYEELGNGVFLDFLPRLIYNKERLPINIYDKTGDKAAVDIKGKLCIDIFVLDEASRNQKKHMRAMTLMKGIYALCMGHRGVIDYNEYRELTKNAFILLKMVHLAGKCIPLKLLMAVWNRLCLYAAKEECDDYFTSSIPITHIERKQKKEFFGNGQRMQFNDMEVSIPSNYNDFLGMIYRNYMKLPPMATRRPSHYFMNTDMKHWRWRTKSGKCG